MMEVNIDHQQNLLTQCILNIWFNRYVFKMLDMRNIQVYVKLKEFFDYKYIYIFEKKIDFEKKYLKKFRFWKQIYIYIYFFCFWNIFDFENIFENKIIFKIFKISDFQISDFGFGHGLSYYPLFPFYNVISRNQLIFWNICLKMIFSPKSCVFFFKTKKKMKNVFFNEIQWSNFFILLLFRTTFIYSISLKKVSEMQKKCRISLC